MGGLELLIAAPLVGAAVVLGLGSAREHVGAWVGVAVGSVTLVASVFPWVATMRSDGDFVATTDASWIAALDVRWSLGVDALSAPLVVLTALLSWCCLVALLRRAPDCGFRPGLIALVLVIEAASIGTFAALDLIVFFVFFELVLIPMWFVIADWGDEHDPVGRRRAATRFLVVTVIGSALMLIGFVILHAKTGTFDLIALETLAPGIDHATQVVIATFFMVGFGAKVPMWPLHFWLPDAHSKAPTVGSVLLAGVLLKLGTYGLLRFWYDVVPAGAVTVAPYLGALAVVGIVYGSLACLAQTDVKRLIAYSSVGHMGFVLLAVSTMTAAGTGSGELRQRLPRHHHRPALLRRRGGQGPGRSHRPEDRRTGALRPRTAPRVGVRVRGHRQPGSARPRRLLGRDAGDAGSVRPGT